MAPGLCFCITTAPFTKSPNQLLEYLILLLTGSDIGDVCPTGSYCPEGTDEPVECPAGTFNPDLGRMALSECLDCTGGFHCNTTGEFRLSL